MPTFCAVAHKKGVPVIVDGAAEPDPRIFLKAGADLVITSMQKAFASFTAGTVAGRRDLVRACYLQDKGIGRPMKIGKEGVIATIAALERWAELDHGAIHAERMARLERCKAKLDRLPGVTVTVELDSTSKLFSRLLLHVDPARAGITAAELAQALWDETPSIAVRNLMADIGLLQVDFRRADEGRRPDHRDNRAHRGIREGARGRATPIARPQSRRCRSCRYLAVSAEDGCAALIKSDVTNFPEADHFRDRTLATGKVSQKSNASLFAGAPLTSEASGLGSAVPGSRKRLVIG